MPAQCFFTLNSRNFSTLFCPGLGGVIAFSGNGKYVDDPNATAIKNKGPIPKGRYYIVIRQHGGRFGSVRDAIKDAWSGSNRSTWFALYRHDGRIDDETTINGVSRNAFRLHPGGKWSTSNGCITVTSQAQFDRLRAYLLSQETKLVPGTNLPYYGTIDVR
ncbi:DUF2778 domain-containing protein [Burkholderia gladioli]|uniref:DUF2778 domain-containing protein n=1 Tax=Burkholderia gladioli TaxID=28095 RepID=UPI0016407E6B|nr:DUF2778 domain-containing protein [Burkholderia gladioli]